MCTCLTIKNRDFYAGRNLDLDLGVNEMFIVTPRNYPFNLRKEKTLRTHYAIYGMGTVIDNYPLYFDAANEEGLYMAGLRFNEEIKSHKLMEDKINLAQFELIPFVLGTAKNVKEARKMLERINLIELNFNKKVSSSRLHYLITDKKECIVIESGEDGIYIYDNPLGVLTNSPNFAYHLENVRNYLNITSNYVSPRFAKNLNLGFFSTGAGTFSLPGDLTSPSRFIRALFYKNNIILEAGEDKTINSIFKIFDSVSFINGSALCLSNNYEKTIYTGLINLDKNIYYYKTYDNSNISMLELRNYDIHDNKLITVPLNREFKIYRH